MRIERVFSLQAILVILGVSFLYLCIGLLTPNYRLLYDTLLGTFSLHYKLVLFFSLVAGLFTALSPIDTFLLLATSLLVGINMVLLVKAVRLLGMYGKLHLSVGTATVVGLVATGCTSCGFSLLAVLGLGASLSFLPFKGMEIHILSVLFLFGSAIYMLLKLVRTISCRII